MAERYSDQDRQGQGHESWRGPRQREGEDLGGRDQRRDWGGRGSEADEGRGHSAAERDQDYGRGRSGQGDGGDYGGSHWGQGGSSGTRQGGQQGGQHLGQYGGGRSGGQSGEGTGRGASSRFGEGGQEWSGGFGQMGGSSAGQTQYGRSGSAGRPSGPHAGKGPKGYRRSDDRIREDISDALERDGDIDASEIEIEVRDCEVVLKGTVDSREAKRSAEDLAESIQGVKDVRNELRVTRGGGQIGNAASTARSTDAEDQTRGDRSARGAQPPAKSGDNRGTGPRR
jgi:osmotically-inducible protein OsmY